MGRKAVSYLLFCLAVAFTGLLLAAAVLSCRASFFLPEQGTFWATLAMLLPVLLLANVVLLIVWLVRRRWVVALLPLTALLLNLNYISAMIQLPDIGNGSSESDFRIGTVNANGFKRQTNRTASAFAIDHVVAQEKLDILCMQEFLTDHVVTADSIATIFARQLPYFVSGKGQAIASRYPILAHEYVRFADTNNDFLQADVLIGRDTVRVFSVHLQTSGISGLRHRFRKSYNQNAPVEDVMVELDRNNELRAKQVATIRRAIAATRYPVIVAGDFNDMPSSYTYRAMKGDLTDGFQAAGNGFGGTFRYLGGILRIDYIFYDDTFEGVGYRTSEEDVSDHKAVVTGLRFRR